jgi:hypothetical protein
MEPFLLRYTCSYEYVPTLGTHPNSTSTFEHVQSMYKKLEMRICFARQKHEHIDSYSVE